MRSPSRDRDGDLIACGSGCDQAGAGSTARISAVPLTHLDALPVRRTSGVAKPRQVQPSTLTGPPPPLPGSLPDAIASAYFRSMLIASSQSTLPRRTSMVTGTLTAVLVVPHEASARGVAVVGGAAGPWPFPLPPQPAAARASASAARPSLPQHNAGRLPPVIGILLSAVPIMPFPDTVRRAGPPSQARAGPPAPPGLTSAGGATKERRRGEEGRRRLSAARSELASTALVRQIGRASCRERV